MGAWGGWALAPNTAMGRDYRSHMKLVAEGLPHVQNGRRIFLTSWGRISCGFSQGEAYRPAGRPPSRESDFSEATVATGGSRERIAGNSFVSEAFSPVLVRPVFVSLDFADTATGDGTSAVALTAAKALASPAPKIITTR